MAPSQIMAALNSRHLGALYCELRSVKVGLYTNSFNTEGSTRTSSECL